MKLRASSGLGALLAGTAFGLGLVLSGMTRPEKVLGFLDPLGAWDPSLLWVMSSAVAVHTLAYRLIRGWRAPLAAPRFELPKPAAIDRRLLVGAGIFGVGWGLGGYCPGPSLVALPSFTGSVWVFVVAMLAGSWLASRLEPGASSDQSPGTLSRGTLD
jgi:uncharacterized membrane protein YedE/YeeE